MVRVQTTTRFGSPTQREFYQIAGLGGRTQTFERISQLGKQDITRLLRTGLLTNQQAAAAQELAALRQNLAQGIVKLQGSRAQTEKAKQAASDAADARERLEASSPLTTELKEATRKAFGEAGAGASRFERLKAQEFRELERQEKSLSKTEASLASKGKALEVEQANLERLSNAGLLANQPGRLTNFNREIEAYNTALQNYSSQVNQFNVSLQGTSQLVNSELRNPPTQKTQEKKRVVFDLIRSTPRPDTTLRDIIPGGITQGFKQGVETADFLTGLMKETPAKKIAKAQLRTVLGVTGAVTEPLIRGAGFITQETGKAINIREFALGPIKTSPRQIGELGAEIGLLVFPQSAVKGTALLGKKVSQAAKTIRTAREGFAFRPLELFKTPRQIEFAIESRDIKGRKTLQVFQETVKPKKLIETRPIEFVFGKKRDLGVVIEGRGKKGERVIEFLEVKKPKMGLGQRGEFLPRQKQVQIPRNGSESFFGRTLTKPSLSRPLIKGLEVSSKARNIALLGLASRVNLGELVSPKSAEIPRIARKQKTATRVREITRQRKSFEDLTGIRSRFRERTRNLIGVKSASVTAQVFEDLLGEKTVTLEKSRERQGRSFRTRFGFRDTFRKVMGNQKSKPLVVTKGQQVMGFHAYVKEEPFSRKRYRKVTKKPLPFTNALQRGFFVADNTIGQSVKVVRAGKVKKQPSPGMDLGFKFGFKPKRKIFIEKRSNAIDTIGEKQKLKVSAFLAREKKKGKRFFFGAI